MNRHIISKIGQMRSLRWKLYKGNNHQYWILSSSYQKWLEECTKLMLWCTY